MEKYYCIVEMIRDVEKKENWFNLRGMVGMYWRIERQHLTRLDAMVELAVLYQKIRGVFLSPTEKDALRASLAGDNLRGALRGFQTSGRNFSIMEEEYIKECSF